MDFTNSLETFQMKADLWLYCQIRLRKGLLPLQDQICQKLGSTHRSVGKQRTRATDNWKTVCFDARSPCLQRFFHVEPGPGEPNVESAQLSAPAFASPTLEY
jgi:hypothetical protein